MARPKKTSLRYFPFDVDFFESDIMVYIAGEFGLKGEIITVRLLCAVYRKGYFLEWTDLVKYKLKKDLPGISATLLDQIVARLVKWDFFNKELFDSSRILTSVEIQQCYFEATKRCVKPTELPYLLIELGQNYENTSEAPVNAAETPIYAAETPQIKENKIKENKTKPNKGGSHTRTRDTSPPPSHEGFEIDYFQPPTVEQLRETVRSPELQYLGPTLADAADFKAYYAARGWKIGGDKMHDWRAAFRSWLSKKSRFGDARGSKTIAQPTMAQTPKNAPVEPSQPYTPPSPEFLAQLNETAPWNIKREA